MAPRGGSSQGLPRSVRLRTPNEFQHVQAHGRSVDLGPLVFRLVPTAGVPAAGAGPASPSPARLGLAISRKVGNAVARNHVKRRVRDCFRRRKASLTGYDLVVTGRPTAAELETADVDRLFEQLLRRLGRT